MADFEDFAEEYAAAWSTQNIETIPSFFTEDCVYEDVTLSAVNTGKQQLEEAFVRATFAAIPGTPSAPSKQNARHVSFHPSVARTGSSVYSSGNVPLSILGPSVQTGMGSGLVSRAGARLESARARKSGGPSSHMDSQRCGG